MLPARGDPIDPWKYLAYLPPSQQDPLINEDTKGTRRKTVFAVPPVPVHPPPPPVTPPPLIFYRSSPNLVLETPQMTWGNQPTSVPTSRMNPFTNSTMRASRRWIMIRNLKATTRCVIMNMCKPQYKCLTDELCYLI